MNKSFVTSGVVPVERRGWLGLSFIAPSLGAALELKLDLQGEPSRG